MNLNVNLSASPMGDAAPIEVVERKGIGHPDTICDALAEELTNAITEAYVDHFGAVLHHNVDKVLLAAGQARPAYGGGEVLAPFEIFFAGRAIREFDGVAVPIDTIAEQPTRRWLQRHLPRVDAERHVRVHTRIRAGAVDRLDLFRRNQHVGVVLANDTSCGIGHWPLSTLERAVLAVERRLNAPLTAERHPFSGEDVKVLGVRNGERIEFTVANAVVDRFVADADAYRAAVAVIADMVHEVGAEVCGRSVGVAVNAGDDIDAGRVHLTVTGTSAEDGDDGCAGRGNRVGGFAAPLRPTSLDAAAGKNPVLHTGKLYNVVARMAAEALVQRIDGVHAANCCLVSRIGAPLSEPQLVHVDLQTEPDQVPPRGQIEKIIGSQLERVGEVWQQLREHALPIC